jgi:hypothetical protein
MKVGELIAKLLALDAQAEVLMQTEEHWGSDSDHGIDEVYVAFDVVDLETKVHLVPATKRSAPPA